jgi:hypothetical protein
MAQQHLNLLKLAAPGPAELSASAPEIVRSDAGNAGCVCVGLDQLPDDLFRQDLAAGSVCAINGPEHAPVCQHGSRSPGIDRRFHPVRHWGSTDPAVLANEIHDAPTTVALLNMSECEGRHLGSSQAAAQKDGYDGPIPQPLGGRGIGRAQERLCLPQRQPVPSADTLRFRALHSCDAGCQLGR